MNFKNALIKLIILYILILYALVQPVFSVSQLGLNVSSMGVGPSSSSIIYSNLS